VARRIAAAMMDRFWRLAHRYATAADAVKTIFLPISTTSLAWARVYIKMLASVDRGV
jgi:hypothetical protein